jgi:soluble lytic murein transglycosylase-like protein
MSTVSIQSLVASIANAMGLNPQIALAQAQQESGFNPSAVNPGSGATGVMQLLPSTAAGLGVTNLLDPTQNVTAGLTYYQQLLNQFGGDQQKALAAYDWGPGNVSNAVQQYGANWLSAAPSETQNYVSGILGSAASAPTVTLEPDASASIPTDYSGYVLAGAAAALALGAWWLFGS